MNGAEDLERLRRESEQQRLRSREQAYAVLIKIQEVGSLLTETKALQSELYDLLVRLNAASESKDSNKKGLEKSLLSGFARSRYIHGDQGIVTSSPQSKVA